MAKRFGRNQRRKLLEQVHRAQYLEAMAQREIARLNDRIGPLQRAADNAVEIAFERFMANEKMVRKYLFDISRAVGEKLGAELLPIAKKILDAQREQPFFSARPMETLEGKTIVLRGTIPRIEYNIAMMVWSDAPAR